MQTFLPYHDFEESARVLDTQRLNKQRVEALHILKILAGQAKSYGWANHPAVNMWRGHEGALKTYGILVCQEYMRRPTRVENVKAMLLSFSYDMTIKVPEHFTEEFHLSHRCNLYHKFPSYYKQFFGENLPVMDYVWPIP